MKEREYLDAVFRRHDGPQQGALEFVQFAGLLQELNGGQQLSEAETMRTWTSTSTMVVRLSCPQTM